MLNFVCRRLRCRERLAIAQRVLDYGVGWLVKFEAKAALERIRVALRYF